MKTPFLIRMVAVDELCFSIHGVLEHGSLQEFSIDAGLEELSVPSAGVPEGEPVHVEGVVEPAGKGVLVAIEVSAPYHGECARCLGPVRGQLDAHARELFMPGPTTEDFYGFAGAMLCLDDVVRDLVVTHLPPFVVCDPSCQGLCSICGENRNEHECRHDAPIDPRWAALADLSGESEED